MVLDGICEDKNNHFYRIDRHNYIMSIYSILDWLISNFSLEKINLILDFIKFSHSNFDDRSVEGDLNADFIKN